MVLLNGIINGDITLKVVHLKLQNLLEFEVKENGQTQVQPVKIAGSRILLGPFWL